MYFSLSFLGLFLLGYLFGSAAIKVRGEREAQRARGERESQVKANLEARSPYRLSCPACAAPAHQPCTAIAGVTPAQPHPERFAALRVLCKAECDAFFASLQRY